MLKRLFVRRRRSGAHRARNLPRSQRRRLIVVRRRIKSGTPVRNIPPFHRRIRSEIQKPRLVAPWLVRKPRVKKVEAYQYEEAVRPQKDFTRDILGMDTHPQRCIKRRTRKEVLFAVGVAGRAGRSPGKGGTYRRDEESRLGC